MRASIVITDDAGNVWEYELALRKSAKAAEDGSTRKQGPRKSAAVRKGKQAPQKSDLDFSLPVRPFIKRYASGASGPRKFAILVARLASGDTKVEVAFKDIERQWNRMTQLMGGRFNSAHASRARDAGWVDSPKHGVYKILSGWEGALRA